MRTAVLSRFTIEREDFILWCQRLRTVLFERWPGVAILVAGGGTSAFVKAILEECARTRDMSSDRIEEEIGRWVRIEYPMADIDALRKEPLPEEVVEDIERSFQ
jgi:hypothetical protein